MLQEIKDKLEKAIEENQDVETLRGNICCSTCKEICLVGLEQIDPLIIGFTCPKCKGEGSKVFEKISENCFLKKDIGFCEAHKKAKNMFYCYKCRINFCRKCKQQHQEDHKKSIISLSKIAIKGDLEAAIQKAKTHINELNRKLYNSCLEKLMREIERVESIFQKNIESNKRLFHFIDFISNNYSPNVYQLIENAREFLKFKLKTINERESNTTILSFVMQNYVLTPFKPKFLLPNFLDGLCKIKTLNCCRGGDSICLLKEDRLVYCSRMNGLGIINLETYEEEAQLRGSDFKSIIGLRDGNVACIHNGLVKIWKIEENTFKELHAFTVGNFNMGFGNSRKIVEFSDNKMGYTSEKTLFVLETVAPFQVIKQIDFNNYIFSFNELKNLKYIAILSANNLTLLDGKTYDNIHVFSNIYYSYCYDLQELNNNRFIVGKWNTSFLIINASTFQVETEVKIKGVSGISSITQLNSTTLLCGSLGGIITEIDLKECKIVNRKKFGRENVQGLFIGSDNLLVVFSNSGHINIYH